MQNTSLYRLPIWNSCQVVSAMCGARLGESMWVIRLGMGPEMLKSGGIDEINKSFFWACGAGKQALPE